MRNMTTVPRAKHCMQEHNNTNLDQQRHAEDAGALTLGHKKTTKTSASLYDNSVPLLMHNMTTVPCDHHQRAQRSQPARVDQQLHAKAAILLVQPVLRAGPYTTTVRKRDGLSTVYGSTDSMGMKQNNMRCSCGTNSCACHSVVLQYYGAVSCYVQDSLACHFEKPRFDS
jgi:hypothetical protein